MAFDVVEPTVQQELFGDSDEHKLFMRRGLLLLAMLGVVCATTAASGARLEVTASASVGGMLVNGAFALPNNTTITPIDNFDTPGLGEYTFSKVLDQGTATNVAFSDAGGTIDITSTGADGAEQVLLLRNDVTLAQGQQLQLDAPTSFMDRDFGLAVRVTVANRSN